MLDEQDQGTRIGVGVALGVVMLLLVGLLGWLTMRGGQPSAPAATRVVQAAAAVTPTSAAKRIVMRKPESPTGDGRQHHHRD